MTPKDYQELEAFVAEAIEANQYKRPEIAARNLLSAMQAVGVAPVPVEATEEMLEAMAVHSFQYSKYKAAIAASPYRRKE